MTLQRKFSQDDIKLLAQLIKDFQVLHAKTPPFQGCMIPKHHFAQHFAYEILQHGPPRGYWTFRHVLPAFGLPPPHTNAFSQAQTLHSFEAFHQRIKRWARESNWKLVGKRVCNMYAHWWSLRLARRKLSNS